MTITLSPEIEKLINESVQSGRYESASEVLEEALLALKEREDSDYREAVEGIRRGLEDIEAGRIQPLAEAFADIRRRHDVSG